MPYSPRLLIDSFHNAYAEEAFYALRLWLIQAIRDNGKEWSAESLIGYFGAAVEASLTPSQKAPAAEVLDLEEAAGRALAMLEAMGSMVSAGQ